MPSPKVIVACVRSFETPIRLFSSASAAPLRIHFEDGQVAYLNPRSALASTYAQVLDELHQASLNVYVEVDPENQMIADVQVPVTGQVASLEYQPGGDLNFTLDTSQRRYSLSRSSPQHQNFLQILREAYEQNNTIILTEKDEEPEIVDIRLAQNPTQPTPPKGRGTAPALQVPQLQTVTMETARDLFRMVSSWSCNPKTGAPPCIPFLYPYCGCTARAHKMCQLIMNNGVEPCKIWNFGNLKVITANEPHCHASWWFHVAPVLQVTAPDSSVLQPYAVDPSVFDEPVPAETWFEAQGDPYSRPLTTSPEPFVPRLRGGGFEYDPTYGRTEKLLTQCRAALRRRCGACGPPPPPYVRCLQAASSAWVITEPTSLTHE